MGNVKLTIEGQAVKVNEGAIILEAALFNDIDTPRCVILDEYIVSMEQSMLL